MDWPGLREQVQRATQSTLGDQAYYEGVPIMVRFEADFVRVGLDGVSVESAGTACEALLSDLPSGAAAHDARVHVNVGGSLTAYRVTEIQPGTGQGSVLLKLRLDP